MFKQVLFAGMFLGAGLQGTQNITKTGRKILGCTVYKILSRTAGQEFNPLSGEYQDLLMGRNLNWAENTRLHSGQKFNPLGRKY